MPGCTQFNRIRLRGGSLSRLICLLEIGLILLLLTAFVLVCVAEVVVGVMLLRDVPKAATVSYLLLPVELVFWFGFDVHGRADDSVLMPSASVGLVTSL